MTILCNCWGGGGGGCLDNVSTGPSNMRLEDTVDNQLSSYALSLSLTCGRRGLVCYPRGGDLDYLVTHTHTLLSQISIHFHPSTPHCVLPQGQIMSWACDKEPGSSRRGEGGVGADCQTGRAGFSRSLPLSAPSVSFSVLAAAADLSVPRGLCERREM